MHYKIFSVMTFLSLADETPPGTILAFDTSLLVRLCIQWLNVGLLTAVLVFVLYKPVKKFMAARTERIKNDIDSARQNNEDSLKLKAEYEKKLEEISKEREEILDKAHRDAVREHDKMIFEAQEAAKHLLTRAEEDIKIERENASGEVRRQIIEISMLMASRFVQVSIDHDTQDKYIDEALADWSERTWQA